jgi:general stress protein CsbA
MWWYLHVNMFHYLKKPYFTCIFFTKFTYNEYIGPYSLSHVVLRFSSVNSPRIEWKWILTDLEKVFDVAYRDILKEFDSIFFLGGGQRSFCDPECCFLISPYFTLVLPRWLYFSTFLAIDFSICAKKRRRKKNPH